MLQNSLPFCFIAIIGAFCLAGCDVREAATGPLQKEPIAIDLNDATRANVELSMNAGELDLEGGGDKLLDGYFEYNVPDSKPVVQSTRNGSHAIVTVKEPSQSHKYSRQRNEWALRLNDRTLLDLVMNCGAGKAQLKLGEVALRSLEVHMGAGKVDIDLRGHPTRDYEVTVAGGVGQATVRLPEGVGIRADARGGLGEIEVTGLEKTGDHYENNFYNKAKVNVRISVHGGVGSIRLIG